MKPNFDIYQDITDRIVALMEEHGTDWTRPWVGDSKGSLPRSVTTQKAYTGINVLLLWGARYTGAEWGTYKAWKDKGAQVRKGERGTQIVYFNLIKVADKKTGEDKQIPMLKYYTVFNSSQVEGYQEAVVETPNAVEKQSVAEAFITRTKARIEHGREGAFYIPSMDVIGMPRVDLFTSTDGYYSTLLHELTHWTGASHRLDRLKTGGFGSTEYAKEELVAEIGSAFLCVSLGITKEPREDHAKYLNNWLRALKDDKRAIVAAAKQAQVAVDFLNNEAA